MKDASIVAAANARLILLLGKIVASLCRILGMI
jgi:hypothetical protein